MRETNLGLSRGRGVQILRFSENQPPIPWVVSPLIVESSWDDVNHLPAFTVLVKSEWSFTFDSSICLRDIDKDLPHSSQLYVLGLVVVFSVID
jgi:hypothetical protein